MFQKKCEEEIDKKQRHIRKLEVSVKKLSEELTKGNEIIHRLQNDVKSYHEKVSFYFFHFIYQLTFPLVVHRKWYRIEKGRGNRSKQAFIYVM